MVISLTLEEELFLRTTGEEEEDCDLISANIGHPSEDVHQECIYDSQGQWKSQGWLQRSMAHVGESSE